MVQQPVHRSLATPGKAGIDLSGLLSDMDVDRSAGVQRIQPTQHLAQALGWYRPQRMRGQPQARALCFALWLQTIEQAQHRIGTVNKSSLTLNGWRSAKTAGLVKHRQQRQADPRARRSTKNGLGQRGVIGIGAPAAVVMQVVEFADAGIAAFQHRYVKPGGYVFQLFWRDNCGKAIHERPPAPETVLRFTTVFGQAGKGALERMRVQVWHARQDWPSSTISTRGRRTIWAYSAQATRPIPLKEHVARPPRWQKCMLSEETGGIHAERKLIRTAKIKPVTAPLAESPGCAPAWGW